MSEISVIHTEHYEKELLAVIKQHATGRVQLLFATSVQGWARDYGHKLMWDPVGTALKDASGDSVIVLQSPIYPSDVQSVLDGLDYAGFEAERYAITDNPSAFLTHLVLHELAHIENGWGQEMEDDCDRWAFARLHDFL